MTNYLKPNEIRRVGTKSWPALLLLAACVATRAADAEAIEPADGSEPVAPAAAPAVPAPPGPARVQKVEAFALVGTASYGKDSFAFFDSSDANFKQLLHPGDQIAGCTVAAIATDHVTLKSGAQVIELPVKMQLRRENAGEWKMLEVVENFTAPAPESDARTGSGLAPQFSGHTSSSTKGMRAEAPAGEISEKAFKKLESQIASDLKAKDRMDKELQSAKDGGGKPSKKSSKRSKREP